MRFASWMWLVALVLGPAIEKEKPANHPFIKNEEEGRLPAASGAIDALFRTGPRLKIQNVAYRQERSSRLSARWLGQDGHDYVGPNQSRSPSDIQDIHIQITGLDPRREVVFVEVSSTNGNYWRFEDKPSAWQVDFRRSKGARTGDAFFEPAGVETGRPFHVLVRYDDGSTVEADLRGGNADHRLPVAGVALVARWVGQDRQDRTGTGPSVGPDGFQDVRIHLNKLSTRMTLQAIRIEGPGGASWEFGANPKLLSTADLIRDPKDPAQGDLFFQPTRDMAGQRLKLTAVYENNRPDTVTVTAGRCDSKLRVPQTPLPKWSEPAVTARWLGQDAANPAAPGDVHVAISGVPASSAIAGAMLSNSQRGVWIYRGNDRAVFAADAAAEPFTIKSNGGRRSIDLFFPPLRDESKSTMTLRLIAADGRNLIVQFPGGSCDPGKRARGPEPTQAAAKPGDDLQSLVDRFGSVTLASGTYRLGRPLVLNHPVTLTSQGGATLLFSQAAGEPPWTTAIKIHCGNTTLNGFAVRFAGPIRWNNDVSWGPAVIGMTDNLDQRHDDLKVNVAFTRLDLEIPPVEKPDGWVEALRLMRLIGARCGLIEGNTLRGGMIEFLEGPWRIVDNDFRGTPPGTSSHGVFAGHGTHDLVIRGNKTHAVGPSGKTWRFLVLTWYGADDLVEGNTIEQVGARDDDTIPWGNEPEVILTEGYHLKYEGKVMGRSKDGRLVRTGPSLGEPVRTGDAISLLNGPAAGGWRKVVQPIDATSYLVDAPIPAETDVVSIATGFVNETFQDNRIDLRGGRRSTPIVLPGNHFGARIIKNQFFGGCFALKLTAFATETPVMWGWSHTPFLGGVIEGNILEDSDQGAILGVEHDGHLMKTNQGRTYMSVKFNENVVRWSESFLSRLEASSPKQSPVGLTLGYQPSHDAHELIVTARDNRLEAPAGRQFESSLVIHAADYNSERLLDRKLSLSGKAHGAPREASKKSGSRPR